MSNLPKGWEEVKLGDFCDILDNQRIPISSEKRAEIRGNIPYYGANGVQDYINDFIFNETLVLLAEDGGNFNDYQTRPIAYMIHGKSWVNNHTHVLRAKNGENYFLFYSLVHKDITSFINGGTRTKLNRGELVKIPIFVPPLEEQKKIADILSTVDKKIAFVEENINATEELKKGLMQKLLTEGIGHTEFKDSELGRIPESWEVVQIKQLGLVVTGSTPKTANKEFYENGIRLWASPSDLGKSKEIKNTATKLSDLGFEQTRILPARSILVTCIGSTIGKIGIAYEEMSTNQQINSVVCNEKNYSDFYYYVLDQQKEYIKKLAGTQAVPLLNKTDFSMIKVIQAPLEEQKQIAEILSTVDKKIENLKEKKQSFEELKKGLMQKLLTGEVRV